ncbi:MAG: EAL domain-containing response regulator [Myxococcota bacterium]
MARILTVDDEPQIGAYIGRALRRAGHEVHETAGGPAAFRLAGHRAFDVAIVDYAMPGQDGLAVLQRLREMQPGCMRILASDMIDRPVAIDAINRGEISRVLEKPFDPTTLVETIDEILDMRRRLDELVQVQRIAAHHEERRVLTRCLNGSDISLALQPIISTQTREIVAFEALLRSAHPSLNGPLPLLRAAEQHEMLGELADVVFAHAAEWLSALPPSMKLFINIHPDELSDTEGFSARLQRLAPWAERVVLELTERRKLQQVANWEQAMARIQDIGMQLAIDDLGSGYNALSLLTVLRPQYVKADMSIIRGVDTDPSRREIVALLQRLSQATGARLIAEGVETPGEAAALVGCMVPMLQGYLFGRPSADRDEVRQWAGQSKKTILSDVA